LIKWKKFRVFLGIIISIFFLLLAFKGLNISKLLHILKGEDPFLSITVILLTGLQYIIRTVRWRFLLDHIKRCSFQSRFSSIIIGFGANCIFPMRVGELIRANYLSKIEKLSASSAFGSIVTERLFDGIAILSFLSIGLYLMPLSGRFKHIREELAISGSILFLLFLLSLSIIVGLKKKEKTVIKILDRFLFFTGEYLRKRILEGILNFSKGIVSLGSPYRIYLTLILSYLLWGLSLVQIFLICRSLQISIPFRATFTVLTMATLGVSVPSGPGFIGTFHISVQYALILLGIGKEEALSAAILWHGCFFFPTLFLALSVIILNHIPFKTLIKFSPTSS